MHFNEAYDPIRALKLSWKLVTQAPLPLLIGGAILVLTNGGGGGGGGNFSGSAEDYEDVNWEKVWPILVGVMGLFCCLGLVFFAISSWVKIGFANTVERVLQTGQAEVGQVFDARGRFWTMVLSRLLVALISLVAAIPFVVVVFVAAAVSEGFEANVALGISIGILGTLVYLPVFLYIVLGLSLADQAVALEGAQPVDSIRRSWSLVSGHRWMMLWYSIATGIFAALGMCACCIGVFLTGTIAEIAKSESFLALTRGGERGSWWVVTGTQPPAQPLGWGSSPPGPGWGAPPPPTPSTPPPLPTTTNALPPISPSAGSKLDG